MIGFESYCQNITCKKPLSSYELERQGVRTFKYRFCRKCRQKPNNSLNYVVWKCRLCTDLMDGRTTIRGKFYCNICSHEESSRRSKIRSKRYYLAKRGKRAV